MLQEENFELEEEAGILRDFDEWYDSIYLKLFEIQKQSPFELQFPGGPLPKDYLKHHCDISNVQLFMVSPTAIFNKEAIAAKSRKSENNADFSLEGVKILYYPYIQILNNEEGHKFEKFFVIRGHF